ncbi:MAG: response regulator [Planctomycetes bacterium]|nr:response regulator [Planctomycetota bacterium]
MTTKACILVVDDDADFRESTKVILESGGYEVITAADGKEGVALAKEHNPALILLDVIMEEVDIGLTIAEEIGKTYPIILLSTIADSSIKVFDANKLPVKRVLQKPVSGELILEEVAKTLS